MSNLLSTFINDRAIITKSVCTVMSGHWELYEKHQILMTDIKIDMTLCFVTIRFEGPGFERGTAVRIHMYKDFLTDPSGNVLIDASKLVVTWDNRQHKNLFDPSDKKLKKIEYLLSIEPTVKS